MLKSIEEFGKHIVIAGFRDVHIGDVEAFLKAIYENKPLNVDIQLFNAEYVVTWQHLYFAVLNALTAFRNEEVAS